MQVVNDQVDLADRIPTGQGRSKCGCKFLLLRTLKSGCETYYVWKGGSIASLSY